MTLSLCEGAIPAAEFGNALRSVGTTPSEEDVAELLDGAGSVDLAKFQEAVRRSSIIFCFRSLPLVCTACVYLLCAYCQQKLPLRSADFFFHPGMLMMLLMLMLMY